MTSHDQWFNEHRAQLMSGVDQLLDDVRHNAAALQQPTIKDLLQRAEQQRTATEEALRSFAAQRQALLETLDHLQSELAIEGRPLRGEVS